MPIKIQNFLFLLGLSAIIGMLYFPVLLHLIYISVNGFIIIAIPLAIVAIATIVGIINLFNSKTAQYIYEKSTKRFPRLQWYSMFCAWMAVVKIVLALYYLPFCLIYDIGAMPGVPASCFVGALFYPNRTWKKRLLSAFIFLGLFIFFMLSHIK